MFRVCRCTEIDITCLQLSQRRRQLCRQPAALLLGHTHYLGQRSLLLLCVLLEVGRGASKGGQGIRVCLLLSS